MKSYFRVTLFTISFLIVCFSCSSQPRMPATHEIEPGAYHLPAYFHELKGKRFALVVNQTSTINDVHLVDTLRSLIKDNSTIFPPNQPTTNHDIHIDDSTMITKVFAPEHGFRGQADAGEKVKDGIDSKTGLPIVSLYGNNKKPTPEQLEDIDVVVFDIQDVGTRFYTYISTMHYIMEACAELGKKVIILDRPNPNGMYVDGPILEPEYKSFVGMHPIPILHGLTVGELALMINGEGWLAKGIKCDLKVIPVKNYSHSMTYSLPVKPSPNLPSDLSIGLYPSLCLFEGTDISVGRGTMKPFQQIGHPSFSHMSYYFIPKSIEGMSKHPKHEGKSCFGIEFDESNGLSGLSLKYLIEYYSMFKEKDKFFISYFNTLAGTDKLQQQIKDGLSEEEIKATWKPSLGAYKTIRKKYLLYPDFEKP